MRNGCSGRPYYNIDANLVKKTRLTEKVKLELRMELFNIFNHTNFTVGTTGINSTNFGQMGTLGSAREVQLNGRVTF